MCIRASIRVGRDATRTRHAAAVSGQLRSSSAHPPSTRRPPGALQLRSPFARRPPSRRRLPTRRPPTARGSLPARLLAPPSPRIHLPLRAALDPQPRRPREAELGGCVGRWWGGGSGAWPYALPALQG
ncbi:hypothetical protein PVAP13_9NG487614 [Panicum virgatum]|uniref:Uncharacterized protein n=1 Tax=Panicum virgatum TaxID=38727 RepID=A0A8T0MT21_PANVG|nr:hypothetical protein PVAP13_9NG487614 [Panicum virgatum]